jgi:hypothetical protein
MRLSPLPTVIFVAITLIYLWLVATLQIAIHADAAHDDALYAKLALNILRGEWLGGYDSLTLLRGPFYSI